MSVTGALALACFVLSLAAGAAGVCLVIRDQRDAGRALARLADPIAEDPVMAALRARDVTMAHYRVDATDRELRRLLGARANQRLSVGLLVAGLVFGFAGTLLTFPW